MYQLHAGMFAAPWALTSVYDTAPLRATLAELVDPARLNAADPQVIVGATNVADGEMTFFDRDLTFEHVAASGSLPPSFPMTRIGTEAYWDGGLFSNTPLSPAIEALERAGGGDRGVERELVDRVDAALPADSDIRDDPTYRRVRAYRRIDHLNVVTSSLPPELSNASDFSRTSVEARIQAGYDDAIAQGIGSPQSAGLRFGVTASHVGQGAGPALLV
jgi:predicted acylesterase/phospholipase RssA